MIGVWLLAEQSTLRMIDSLSMIRACSGRCSQTRMPGTRVAIDRYGPRISAGASGLGSHMSIWLGPPESQNRMTALRSAAGVSARADRRSRSASPKPARPATPVCKNQRREPTRTRSRLGGSMGLAADARWWC